MREVKRYLAVDLHKYYVVVGGVNQAGETVLAPQKVPLAQWPEWALRYLHPTDEVVLAATTNTWAHYDMVAPLAGRVVVAHPPKLPQVKSRKVKTDKQDVLQLARTLAVNWVPTVWVPPQPVRELRALVAQQRRLVKQRTQVRNRLHSLALRHNQPPPAGEPFAAKQQGWWKHLAAELSTVERLALRHDLALEAQLCAQITEVEAELQRLSTTHPWVEQLPFLLQLPGFGLRVAMTLLAAIGDIARFDHAKQLVSYAGLGVGVHDSGETHRTGRITKEGRKEMRWMLVEAARTAVRYHAHWQTVYQRLTKQIGERKAIVAVARTLLVIVWHVLTKRTADRHAIPEKVAASCMVWSWKLTDAQRSGMQTHEWIRYHLLQLGLAEELTHLTYGGMPRRIASVAAVAALAPTFPTAS